MNFYVREMFTFYYFLRMLIVIVVSVVPVTLPSTSHEVLGFPLTSRHSSFIGNYLVHSVLLSVVGPEGLISRLTR